MAVFLFSKPTYISKLYIPRTAMLFREPPHPRNIKNFLKIFFTLKIEGFWFNSSDIPTFYILIYSNILIYKYLY